VRRPVIAVARIELRVDELDFLPRAHPQPEALEALLDHLRPADEDRSCQAFVDHHLHRAQHALVLAFGVDHAPRLRFRRAEERLHDEARLVDEMREQLPARTAASSISVVMVVAPTSRAPRKMNGKQSTLFTWFG